MDAAGSTQPVVFVAYDGSPSAQAAVDRAAALFPAARALVATVWSSVRHGAGAPRVALPDHVIEEAVTELDRAAEAEAAAIAEEGAERARTAGLPAEAAALRAEPAVWSALLRAADDADAIAVVVGSRGRSALRSAVLGSVSHAVVQNAARPVVVVRPEPEHGG